ncbi:MAG: hypothetical protein RLZZ50_1570 [Verrucomicrobiota bacterium]
MIPRPDDSRSAPSAAGKPTLEALLRLKRSERPDEAFWNEFDHGLRQKQLAAIVEPRPWWLGLSLLSRRLAPLALPASAAAAALFAVMIARTEAPLGQAARPVAFAPAPAPLASVSAPALAVTQSESLAPAPVEDASAAEAVLVSDASPVSQPAVQAVPEPAPEPAVAPSAFAALESSAPAGSPALSQPATAIVENPAAAPVEAVELASVVAAGSLLDNSSALGAETATAGAENESDSLQMVAFTPRHARVLLAMADNTEAQVTGGIAHLRDRLVHSLDRDDSIYASASRLGVGGDRLSLSF